MLRPGRPQAAVGYLGFVPHLPRVRAIRYVTPLREGGSLPGVVEADDLGTYVAKFRGAGQGLKVLVAEVIVGQLARHIGIRTPELVVLDLPADIARYEADEEVQDLLNASHGSNLGVDLLPGAFGYDGGTPPPTQEATAILWLDAFTLNVDRTWSNPNLLRWHRQVWAIDHGAALYVHHSWPSKAPDPERFAGLPYAADSHLLRSVAEPTLAIHDQMRDRLSHAAIDDIVSAVPSEWLELTPWLLDTDAVRAAYVDHLRARLATPQRWWVTA